MAHTELLIFGLLVAVAGLAVVARVVRVPYPIPLTIGGLALGFAPGVPDVSLDPDLVLLIFLPPLLYSAAFFANLRELRDNLRPITGLAVGLVAGTMAIVAVIGHEVIGLPWAAAFVLGAVVSPADAVAPAEILRRLNVPRRVITIVQGENLTNDWTALVAYKFAVAAVVTGSFSLWEAGPRFVFTGVGGIAIGVGRGRADRGGAPARGRPADRHHDLAADRVRGLPAGGGGRRLGRDRRGHGRRLAGLAVLRADRPRHAPPAVRHLGGAAVPAQRLPVHPDRAPAAGGDRQPERPVRG